MTPLNLGRPNMGWLSPKYFKVGDPFTIQGKHIINPRPVSRVEIGVGDTLTIGGLFKRRTFWEWVTRRPAQPLTFNVKSVSASGE